LYLEFVTGKVIEVTQSHRYCPPPWRRAPGGPSPFRLLSRHKSLNTVEQESSAATADVTHISSPRILSPQVTATGAMAILDSQEVTSDTELLAVADALLSMRSQPAAQQTPL